MLMEQDPDVAVTVRKLVIVSLMELFKDVTPSYKIRPLTEAEKSSKVILGNDYRKVKSEILGREVVRFSCITFFYQHLT